MRISTAQAYRQGIEQMQLSQQALLRAQQQLSSQQRMASAADDPNAWAAAAGLDQVLQQNGRYAANAESARHQLLVEEDALAEGIDVLTRVRELTIQANTASQSDESRAAIATELDALREQLLAVANRDDGQGRYIFAGSVNGGEPFSWSGSTALYSGDQQVRQAQIGAQRSIDEGDAGSEVFLRLKTGNGTFAVAADAANSGSAQLGAAKTYDASLWDGGDYRVVFSGGDYQVLDAADTVVQTGSYSENSAIRFRGVELSFSGTPADGDTFTIAPSAQQDMFALVDQLAQLIGSPQPDAASRAQFQTALQQKLTELDRAQTHLSSVRTGVGIRLNAVDSASSQLSALDLHAQEALSNLRDVDIAEAASRLQQELLALQAAQQTYTQVQGLSLFNYLR